MFRPRVATLSILVISVAVIVGGCASAQAPTSDTNEANSGSSRGSSQPAPTPTPTVTPSPSVSPTPAATPTVTPTPAATPSLVALPKLSKKIAGATKVSYFPVVGESPAELIAQTVTKSAAPCKSKVHDVLACVIFKSGGERWIDTTNSSTGSCKVTSVTVVKPTSTVQPAPNVWDQLESSQPWLRGGSQSSTTSRGTKAST